MPVAVVRRCPRRFDRLQLIATFEGDVALERVLHSLFPPDFAEFWKAGRLDGILAMLRLMTAERATSPKPPLTEPPGGTRRPCCGGRGYRCLRCEMTFATYSHLKQHMTDKHLRQDTRTKCPKCNKEIKQQRNLKAHQASSACRGA